MSDPNRNEAKAMMSVVDAAGNRVTTDNLEPGDYKLVLEVINILAAVGNSASHLALNVYMTTGSSLDDSLQQTKVVPVSNEEKSVSLPFSVEKWMSGICAVGMLYLGNAQSQTYLLESLELRKKVVSQYE
jgi:hypothetical protein